MKNRKFKHFMLATNEAPPGAGHSQRPLGCIVSNSLAVIFFGGGALFRPLCQARLRECAAHVFKGKHLAVRFKRN